MKRRRSEDEEHEQQNDGEQSKSKENRNITESSTSNVPNKKGKAIVRDASRKRKIVLSLYFYRISYSIFLYLICSLTLKHLLFVSLYFLEPEFYHISTMKMVKENSAPVAISKDGLTVSHDKVFFFNSLYFNNVIFLFSFD